ncbi:MAG: hypothetical protein H6Q42_3770, partial [Deltaproteobacteria bacterium]|nr:hypothetical protein [Deltaproteobacteria bacterium]
MKKRVVLWLVVGIFMAGLIFVDSAPKAQQKVITWTGQSCLPPGMPVAVGLQDLCDRIKAASGGRLIWNAKPAGSVCPATKEWQSINKGVLDFAATGGSYLVPEIPFGSIVSQRVGAKISPLGHMM